MDKSKKEPYKKIVATNRKARYNYSIEEVFEAGIVLTGSEVKSLREGKANIADSYADQSKNELFLLQAYIAEYTEANRFNHYPTRPRKLLMHRREISKLMGKVKMKGYSLIPLELYFNDKNKAKLSIGLAKGKKLHDKRETEKQRDWNRQKQQLIKHQL